MQAALEAAEDSFSSVSDQPNGDRGGEDEFDVFSDPKPAKRPQAVSAPLRVQSQLSHEPSKLSSTGGSTVRAAPAVQMVPSRRLQDSDDEQDVSIEPPLDDDDSSTSSEDAGDLIARADLLLRSQEKSLPHPSVPSTTNVPSTPCVETRMTRTVSGSQLTPVNGAISRFAPPTTTNRNGPQPQETESDESTEGTSVDPIPQRQPTSTAPTPVLQSNLVASTPNPPTSSVELAASSVRSASIASSSSNTASSVLSGALKGPEAEERPKEVVVAATGKELRPFVWPKSAPERTKPAAKEQATKKRTSLTTVPSPAMRAATPPSRQVRAPSPSRPSAVRQMPSPQRQPSPQRSQKVSASVSKPTTPSNKKPGRTQVIGSAHSVPQSHNSKVAPDTGKDLAQTKEAGNAAQGLPLQELSTPRSQTMVPKVGLTENCPSTISAISKRSNDDSGTGVSWCRPAGLPSMANSLLSADGPGINMEEMRDSIERLTTITLEMNRIKQECAQRRDEIRRCSEQQKAKEAASAMAEAERQDRGRILMKLVQEHNQRARQFNLPPTSILEGEGNVPYVMPRILGCAGSNSALGNGTLNGTGARIAPSTTAAKVAEQILAVHQAAEAHPQRKTPVSSVSELNGLTQGSSLTSSVTTAGRMTPPRCPFSQTCIDGYAARRLQQCAGHSQQSTVRHESPKRVPRAPRRQSLPTTPAPEPPASWRQVRRKERSNSNTSFRDCWSRLYVQGLEEQKTRLAWAEEAKKRQQEADFASCSFAPDIRLRTRSRSPSSSPNRRHVSPMK